MLDRLVAGRWSLVAETLVLLFIDTNTSQSPLADGTGLSNHMLLLELRVSY